MKVTDLLDGNLCHGGLGTQHTGKISALSPITDDDVDMSEIFLSGRSNTITQLGGKDVRLTGQWFSSKCNDTFIVPLAIAIITCVWLNMVI